MNERAYIRRERVFVGVFLFAMCLALAHFVHSAWFSSAQADAASRVVRVDARLYAPEAYRVAMVALVPLLQRIFHGADWTVVYGGLDFCFGFAASYLLYRVTVDDLELSVVDVQGRFIVVALLLAFLQFPMTWVVPWQRPETMPTALYVAFALFCVSREQRKGMGFLLLLMATAWQGFVRSDVPFVLGLAMMLMSVLRPLGSRVASLLRSGCVVLVAGGVQMYLQYIRFPHLAYPPGTPVIQFGYNLTPHNLRVFITAMLPFIVLAFFLIWKRPSLRRVDALAVAAAALYLPLWFTVGSVGEVRIFVPFSMALCMVAARALSACIAGAA